MRRSTTAVLLLAFCPSTLVADPIAGRLPFRLYSETDIVVPVTIAGQGPFRFLLDTGSSRSAITASGARRLGLQAVAKTLMMTPAGQEVQSLVRLERVALGPTAPVTVLAMIVPDDVLGRGLAIDGLIGQDALQWLTYTIDYDRRELVWPSVRDETSGIRLQLVRTGGRFLVMLPQKSGAGLPLQVIPDSGADCLVLFDGPGRTLPALTPLDTASLRTLSGRRLVRRVLIDALDVGDVGLLNQMAVLVKRRDAHAPFGDGLLPLHLFSRVTFNGPEGYMVVEGSR